MKLSVAFEEFLDFATLERCLSSNTINWYRRCFKPFVKYLRYDLLATDTSILTADNLRKYFVSQRLHGNTPRTILNSMQGIRSFCVFLVKKGHLTSNPVDSLEKPKLQRRLPEFLNEEESRELLTACINLKSIFKSKWVRDIAIISLFLFTGVRRKELLNLKLGDLNLERGYIKVSAKNKERLVPLNSTAKEFLVDYLKARPERGVDYLFVSTNRNGGLTSQGLYDIFKNLKQQVNFHKKISPQILRHTFCTLMLRNGVNIRDIQLLAGHSDISTTAKFYLGCDEKQLKKAVDKHPLNI